MLALIPRLAAAAVTAVLAATTLGCGAHVAAPTPAPLHRAALAHAAGGSLQATFRLPARRLLNTSGAPALTVSDVRSVTLYLVEAPIGAPPTGALSPVSGSGFTYVLDAGNLGSSQVDVLYTNVPANGPGLAYFLAVSAVGDAGNITNAAAPATISPLGRCYVSSAGGDVDAPGSVRVAPETYALSATAPLSATLKLQDARAASLHTSVTITDGDDTP